MNRRGLTVWLDAGEERTYERLLVGRYKRPSIATLSDDELLAFIRKSMEERRQYYGQARHALTPRASMTATRYNNRLQSS